MFSNDDLQRALCVTLAARTRHAMTEGATIIFVETREMAALLGIPFAAPLEPDMDTAALGMAEARLALLCEQATREYRPNLDREG